MADLTLLRRLAERHAFEALREACMDADLTDPGVQVLLALADVHLGDASAGARRVGALAPDALPLDVRVDLAAVHMARGALKEAVAVLESARESAHDGCAEHALLLARLAWCRQQQGQHDAATTLYERSLARAPRIAVYENLLRLHRDCGRLTAMAQCLDAARAFWADEELNWPDAQRRSHSRQLRELQLDLWLAEERTEAAETWIEQQREALDADDWCALLAAFAQRLVARDRHAHAEACLRVAIDRHPEHSALTVQLAELAHLQGRTPQAVALLRKAIRLAKVQGLPAGRLLTRLSTMALLSNGVLARAAAEQARVELEGRAGNASCTHAHDNETTESRFEVELALAAVEAREDDYVAAERRCREVLALRPRSIPALKQLGQMLLQLGRIDEAIAMFEAVKAIDPALGHDALFHVRRFPDDEPTLQRLESLARTPGTEGSVRIGLLFQFAAAWERRGAYDRAFALADEANAANRRLLRYDPKAHRDYCARVRHAFPRALYAHRPHGGHDSTVPVFVVGMPRSGTTLIESILAGHSRIHGAGELGTIPRVIAGLERWERHTGSGRHYPDCVDDLDPRVTRGIAANVLKELRDLAPHADHVVDKLPHNFENIGLIKLLFPRAKIVSVRRDPRDIAVSSFFTDFAGKHGAMGFAYDLDWIGEQLADHNLLMHHWEQVFPGEILEVRYEDVVDDPAASARRMLDYIGVAWEPQVLEFAGQQRPVKTASVWQVRQPLYGDSKGRWQRYRQHLQPLIAATNRKIVCAPIEMVTLPEPGWLNAGVDEYRAGNLDAAEYRFKQLLHHVPEHAAASFLLGSIYVRRGHRSDGIALMETALERCPWNRHWRRDLELAHRMDGRARTTRDSTEREAARVPADPTLSLDYLFLTGDSTTCPSAGAPPSPPAC